MENYKDDTMDKKRSPSNREVQAIEIFRQNRGILRTSEAIKKGIHREVLYKLRDSGKLIQISRGLFRLADLSPLGNPDIVTVAKRVPDAVICLISALNFFEMTTHVSHEIYIAKKRNSKVPKIDFPPVRFYWYPIETFAEGIEEYVIDEFKVKIYCRERTVMDCFKYRNKIGLDIAIEALKLYSERGKMKFDLLERYARMNRVYKIVKPYLEAIL